MSTDAAVDRSCSPPAGARLALAAALGTIWIAAGSTGLLAVPLRNVLVWLGLAVLIINVWPPRRPTWSQIGALAAAVLFTLLAGAYFALEIQVLAVSAVLATLATLETAEVRPLLRLLALAAFGLGLYRLACTTVPLVWHLADRLGYSLGWLAGQLCGQPLWIGATFGGLDFLMVLGVLYAGWLTAAPVPRWPRAVAAGLAILGGQLIYLIALAYSPTWAALLPPAPPPPAAGLEQTPLWAWGDALRTLLPWNVPLLAAVLHTLFATLLLRTEKVPGTVSGSRKRFLAPLFLPVVFAALIPLIGLLAPFRTDLSGKTILAYESGYVNWERPVHDRYGERSAGMLGMLRSLVESLGGRLILSKELSDKELAAADLLLLAHPNQPWTPELHTRIWNYVRGGGALLVAAESRQFQDGLQSTFNEILEPAGVQARYDTLVSETVNWRQTLATSAFAPLAGVGDNRDRLGFWSGASLQVPWSASPSIVGRWGFADPGSDTALAARAQYDPGEKLGDLVLVAQRRVGGGNVVVLGDTAPLTNQVSVTSYLFTGRLLSYLAAKSAGPQVWWREALTLAACLALAYFACRTTDLRGLALTAGVLGCAWVGSTAINAWTSTVLPGRRSAEALDVAYIDSSHLETHSGVSWADMGINGLSLTLMRNGYLPLLLPELTAERLRGARLLIAMGPARAFSSRERAVLREWIEAGGVFLLAVGAEEADVSSEMLAEYGFRVAASPVAPYDSAFEPEPIGCTYATYDRTAQVLMDAGWPVESLRAGAERLIFDPNQESYGLGFRRAVGQGQFVIVGDSRFGVNRNLERADGQPLHGGRHNAWFWRWLLARLAGREAWTPPPEASQLPDSTKTAQELSASEEQP